MTSGHRSTKFNAMRYYGFKCDDQLAAKIDAAIAKLRQATPEAALSASGALRILLVRGMERKPKSRDTEEQHG